MVLKATEFLVLFQAAYTTFGLVFIQQFTPENKPSLREKMEMESYFWLMNSNTHLIEIVCVQTERKQEKEKERDAFLYRVLCIVVLCYNSDTFMQRDVSCSRYRGRKWKIQKKDWLFLLLNLLYPALYNHASSVLVYFMMYTGNYQ